MRTRPHRSGDESRNTPKFSRAGSTYCGPRTRRSEGSRASAYPASSHAWSYSNENTCFPRAGAACSTPMRVAAGSPCQSAHTSTARRSGATSAFGLAPHGAGQRGILQLAAELIIARDKRQVVLESEAMQDVGDRAQGDTRIATFNGAQRGAGHAG